jgi:hypothetical protein
VIGPESSDVPVQELLQKTLDHPRREQDLVRFGDFGWMQIGAHHQPITMILYVCRTAMAPKATHADNV